MKFPLNEIKNGKSMGTRFIGARSPKEAVNIVKRYYTAGIEQYVHGVYHFSVGEGINGEAD